MFREVLPISLKGFLLQVMGTLGQLPSKEASAPLHLFLRPKPKPLLAPTGPGGEKGVPQALVVEVPVACLTEDEVLHPKPFFWRLAPGSVQ